MKKPAPAPMPAAPLRVIPPAPAQRAALGDQAPYVCILPDDLALEAAALSAGLHARRNGEQLMTAGTGPHFLAFARGLSMRGDPLGAAIERAIRPAREWRVRTGSLPLDRPWVMGIVNLTGDSFSGDGVGTDIEAAVRRAAELREAGAAIIDVGAESARADRPVADAEAEAAVVAPVVASLVREGHLVSIDTYKPAVAAAALEAGAAIVNDISGLTRGTGAAEAAAKAGAGYVLNYSYSEPKRRPDAPPAYTDVVAETAAWMFDHVARLREAGLADDTIAIDPGIAFGKSHDEDLQVLRRLGEFTALGRPLLIAHSRKNFIGSIAGNAPPDRDLETHVATALAYAAGARIFRVHDAAGTARALAMAAALTTAGAGAFGPDSDSWPWRAGASATHMTVAGADKAAPPGQRW
ncbi:MAG: dihydropteroate synthase [Dehalococcoidia bacterium]